MLEKQSRLNLRIKGKNKLTISIIIPVYNEEARLPKTLASLLDYIKRNKRVNFEIIVVDDGSYDKTEHVVNEFQEKSKKIQLIKNGINMGKGFSVRRGMLKSRGDFSLFMDADSSTQICELNNFFPFLDEYNILIGSRHLEKDAIIVKQKLIRRIAGWFAHKLIHLLIISDVKDTMCGFKMFDRKSRILFEKQLNYRWGFDFELLYLAEKLGFKVKEIPVKWKDDRKSKVTTKGYLIALLELFKIRWNSFRGIYK